MPAPRRADQPDQPPRSHQVDEGLRLARAADEAGGVSGGEGGQPAIRRVLARLAGLDLICGEVERVGHLTDRVAAGDLGAAGQRTQARAARSAGQHEHFRITAGHRRGQRDQRRQGQTRRAAGADQRQLARRQRRPPQRGLASTAQAGQLERLPVHVGHQGGVEHGAELGQHRAEPGHVGRQARVQRRAGRKRIARRGKLGQRGRARAAQELASARMPSGDISGRRSCGDESSAARAGGQLPLAGVYSL